MSGQPAPKNGFFVEGIVMRDAYQGPNFSYVTIRGGDKEYWDVGCFEDGPLEAFRALRAGGEARVVGHLGRRKMKNVEGPNGKAVYETTLVADSVQYREGVSTPPRQTRPAPRGSKSAYPPNMQERALHPNSAWPSPAAPHMPTHVTPAEAGVEHAAQFDPDDALFGPR